MALLGICPKKMKTLNSKRYMHSLLLTPPPFILSKRVLLGVKAAVQYSSLGLLGIGMFILVGPYAVDVAHWGLSSMWRGSFIKLLPWAAPKP